MRGLSLGLVACVLAACGGSADEAEPTATSGGELTVADNTNAPPPEAELVADLVVPAVRTYPGRTGSGASPEDPVSACGPGDSYAFVAREFECPEGGNPLGGDPMAGAGARAGNVGANSAGHIIDLYRVPCPSGPVDVYVDMYGCPEMQQRLDDLQRALER
ncbi:MAG TPA: hypothetical protein VIL20_24060 [Sandaracinaceae bacterium]